MLYVCFFRFTGISPPKRSAFYFRLFTVYNRFSDLSLFCKIQDILIAESDCMERKLYTIRAATF
jgi:hypothetical protein